MTGVPESPCCGHFSWKRPHKRLDVLVHAHPFTLMHHVLQYMHWPYLLCCIGIAVIAAWHRTDRTGPSHTATTTTTVLHSDTMTHTNGQHHLHQQGHDADASMLHRWSQHLAGKHILVAGGAGASSLTHTHTHTHTCVHD